MTTEDLDQLCSEWGYHLCWIEEARTYIFFPKPERGRPLTFFKTIRVREDTLSSATKEEMEERIVTNIFTEGLL